MCVKTTPVTWKDLRMSTMKIYEEEKDNGNSDHLCHHQMQHHHTHIHQEQESVSKGVAGNQLEQTHERLGYSQQQTKSVTFAQKITTSFRFP